MARIGSVAPRSVFLRVLLRALVFEWLTAYAVLLTVAAIVFAAWQKWGFAVFFGLGAAALWALIVHQEREAPPEDRPGWPHV
jgi:uncharacterized membrane protein